jgi:hypothetical protein
MAQMKRLIENFISAQCRNLPHSNIHSSIRSSRS